MKIVFEKMAPQHQKDVMKIFNYYVAHSTAAFPGKVLPEPFYGMLLKKTEGGYPSYVLIDQDGGAVAGFCQLSAYSPFSTFAKAACLTYFIAEAYTGKGLGTQCLTRLEADAKQMGIRHLIAEVSSQKAGSIAFHQKHGFARAGELKKIGEKLDQTFGVIYFQKEI